MVLRRLKGEWRYNVTPLHTLLACTGTILRYLTPHLIELGCHMNTSW